MTNKRVKILEIVAYVVLGIMLMGAFNKFYIVPKKNIAEKIEAHKPVSYVNPYMGNTSHLLVPTYPTVHLPNSMLGCSA